VEKRLEDSLQKQFEESSLWQRFLEQKGCRPLAQRPVPLETQFSISR
jgi:hypothetical protein